MARLFLLDGKAISPGWQGSFSWMARLAISPGWQSYFSWMARPFLLDGKAISPGWQGYFPWMARLFLLDGKAIVSQHNTTFLQ